MGRGGAFGPAKGTGETRAGSHSAWTLTSRTEPVLAMIGRLFSRSPARPEVGRELPTPRRSRPTPSEPRGPSLSGPELRRLVAISEPVEPGDVLVLDRHRRGQMHRGCVAGDSAVIGVVSADRSRLAERALVTVSGTVLCKADAEYGAIHIGDTLTVSPTAGHAMHSAIHGPGAILGHALEPLPGGRGLIKVVVTLR